MKKPTLLLRNLRCKASTLTELMVSSAVSTLIAGALIVGCMAVQRSFYASMQYARNQAQQMRVLDYMGLDLKRAMTLRSYTPSLLSMDIPDYYNETAEVPYEPFVTSLFDVQYNSGATIRVDYTLEGSNILRTEGFSNGREVKSIIATDVISWEIKPENPPSTTVMNVSVTFTPIFRQTNRSLGEAGTKLFLRTMMRNSR